MRTTLHDRHRCAQNADHLAHNNLFSPFFAEVVCTLGTTPPQTATSPPPNGGNDLIRASTRRRHADTQLLMLQNPHSHRHGGLRRRRSAWLRCPRDRKGGLRGTRAAAPRGRQGLAGQRDEAPSARSADGRSGRHRHHRQPNFARNLLRSFFEMSQKRWNSNDVNSMFEGVIEELRAKLLVGSHSWASG